MMTCNDLHLFHLNRAFKSPPRRRMWVPARSTLGYETNQIELDGTFWKVKEIRHQEDPRGKRMKKEVPKPTKTATANHRKATMFEKVSSPAKDSFECDTVCPVGVQKRVSSSKLSRPEHGWFIPFVKYYEIWNTCIPFKYSRLWVLEEPWRQNPSISVCQRG